LKWVFTARIDPPVNETVSVRFGASVLFAAYSPILRQWYAVYPGAGEERIPEPPMWLCTDEWAQAHQRKDFKPEPRAGIRIGQREKAVQLSLFG
jgi:hypothetical protein